MYNILTKVSQLFSEPFRNMAYTAESFPLFFALFLGVVGAVAPCQFTSNISAFVLYANESLKRKREVWKDLLLYVLGKILAFSLLGLFTWWIGQEFQRNLTLYFPYARKFIGPLYLIIGFYLLGLFKLKGNFNLSPIFKKKKSLLSSFLLGFSTSLAFCPTMFVIFFVTLMPTVVNVNYGAVLPTIFAIGTAIPFLIGISLIFYLNLNSIVYKKGRKIGYVIQRIAGVFLLIIGVLDIITYW
ncbi:cytochrome c biogenesis CcdA family protein [Priestia megaterium]|uniref:cytochrome c biogenesis CcdA family protein n=1 Tax=Priestia TaxID=2800373 RepID=UPI001C8D0CE6|nr:sulfite exporter TauE/SafE family protein [Priestia aryabhattai]MBY0029780.1 sulfite exporter TauE/SafE family protein [Priestia aryabhattai]